MDDMMRLNNLKLALMAAQSSWVHSQKELDRWTCLQAGWALEIDRYEQQIAQLEGTAEVANEQ
jgi:hypothetical protein